MLLSALALGGCGNGDPASESELAEILRLSTDTTELALVEVGSRPRSLDEVASAYGIDPERVRECGFVAGWETFFQGPDERAHNAAAMSFSDAAGASRFVRLVRSQVNENDGLQTISASGFGREALGWSIAPPGTLDGHLFIWPVDSLVLEVAAPVTSAQAFGRQLDERARDS